MITDDQCSGSENAAVRFYDILRNRSRETPNETIYTFLERRGTHSQQLTYAALETRVRALGRYIIEVTRPQEPVGCVAQPGLDFIVAFLACLWTRRIAVPIPLTHSRTPDIPLFIIRDSQLRTCLCGPTGADYLTRLKDALDWPLKLVDVSSCDPSTDGVAQAEGEVGEIAYLQYTSGSTAAPKGVVVTHENLLANSAQIQRAFGHDKSSVGVIWLPPYHDMGLVGGILQPLFVGFPVYLMSPAEFLRSPLTWLTTIDRYGGTTSGGPNFAFEQCLRRVRPEQIHQLDLSSWRVAFCGAEPILPVTLNEFAAAFSPSGFRAEAFTPCYGLAEATLMVSSAVPGDSLKVRSPAGTDRKYVSCGAPVEGTDVRVTNPDTGLDLPDGEVGEICVQGAAVSCGYWDEINHQGNAGRPERETVPRWLRTGDLGFLSAGELHICGRLKAIAIIRGTNHCLEDIEASVRTSHPLLQGHVCAAFVVETDGGEGVVIMQEAPSELRRGRPPGELSAIIAERIAADHGFQPLDIVFVPSSQIARTRSGKVQRETCKARYLAQYSK